MNLGLAAVIASELIARMAYGLGNPPLYRLDPEIEYLYQPSRRYHYLHHDVRINQHSMRAEDFPASKADPRELRVMVIGDSIVAGGGRVDQADLATERLRRSLASQLDRPVAVGAIAAGSWGFPNQLAYVRRFSLMDADAVILVMNSGDVDDTPGLEPIGGAWPQSRPLMAIQEPIRRGFERAVPGLAQRLGLVRAPETPPPPYEERTTAARQALHDLIAAARQANVRVSALIYLTRPELRFSDEPERVQQLRTWLQDAGCPVHVSGTGPDAFTDDAALFLPGDDVHPSAAGHERLSRQLMALTQSLLEEGTSEKPDPAADPVR